MIVLQATAAFFLGIACVVSFVRYAQNKNSGQLFISCCFLFASAVFGYLAIWNAFLK
jgi:hypothetical protein